MHDLRALFLFALAAQPGSLAGPAGRLGAAVLVFEDDAETGFVRDDTATTSLLTPLLMAEEPPEDAQRVLAGGAQQQLQQQQLQQQQEQQQVGEVVHEGHGVVGCSFHLAKAILGVGITALPRAFLLLGAAPAAAAFLGIGWLTYYSCDCLVRGSLATGRTSYSGVMTGQLGRGAAVALDVSMLVNCFGMMCVYLIVVGDVLCISHSNASMLPVLKQGSAWDLLDYLERMLANRNLTLGLVTLFILAPLLSFRRLKHTTFASGLGVGAIGLWAAATIILGGLLSVDGKGHPIGMWPKWHWFEGSTYKAALRLTAVLPVILCAFMCQMSFFPIVHELHPRTVKGMRRAAGSAIAACFLLFAVLALGSQVLFGNKVQPNVLRNFTGKALHPIIGGSRHLAQAVVWAVRLAYLLSILASFPLQMKPFRDSLAWLVGGEPLLQEWPGFYLATYATLGCVYLAATALPSIWVPLQLVGATAVQAGAQYYLIFGSGVKAAPP
ncbi:hypothetical protein N2152v2_000150 [Parachlorella kessleri]